MLSKRVSDYICDSKDKIKLLDIQPEMVRRAGIYQLGDENHFRFATYFPLAEPGKRFHNNSSPFYFPTFEQAEQKLEDWAKGKGYEVVRSEDL